MHKYTQGDSQSVFLGWPVDRWVGVIGTLVGILGVLLSLWIWRKSREEVRIQYRSVTHRLIGPYNRDSPFNTTEVPLSIRHQDAESDQVSKIYLVVWNAGKKTLDTEQKMTIEDDPLRLSLPEGSVFWGEARVLKVSRDPIKFQASIDEDTPRTSYLSFKFLDQGDGAILEFLCAGPVETYSLAGTFKGSEPIENRGKLWLRSEMSFRERCLELVTDIVTSRSQAAGFVGCWLVLILWLRFSLEILLASTLATALILGSIFLMSAQPGSIRDRNTDSRRSGSLRGVPKELRLIPHPNYRLRSSRANRWVRLYDDFRADVTDRRREKKGYR